MTNNREGDHVLEFTATIGAVRERWTITYENDPALNLHQQVTVNGEWRYTVKYADATGTPRMTLQSPDFSAEIDVLTACADPDLGLFVVIAAQIQNDLDLVHQVIDAMPGQPDQPISPNCYLDCHNQWQVPLCFSEETGCHATFACCMGRAMFRHCVAVHCECPNSAEADCCDDAFQQLVNALDACVNGYVECILADPCEE